MCTHTASLLAELPPPRRQCQDNNHHPRVQERRKRAETTQLYALALPKSLRPRHKPKGGAGGSPVKDYDELVDDSKENDTMKADILEEMPAMNRRCMGGRLPLECTCSSDI